MGAAITAMTHVVLLRGVNVGGQRTFRPAKLAEQLHHLGAVNIGAAGTFVFRTAITSSQLRDELASRLPFDAAIMICPDREFARLLSQDWFGGRPMRPDIVRFVSILSRAPRLSPSLPLMMPTRNEWLVRVLAREGRFVIGEYRRQMKAIGYLGTLDRVFGAPATTRNWNTITAIAKALDRS
jgi:uncharacterized protein (DUF1697 family)